MQSKPGLIVAKKGQVTSASRVLLPLCICAVHDMAMVGWLGESEGDETILAAIAMQLYFSPPFSPRPGSMYLCAGIRQPVCFFVNDRKFSVENSVFFSHQTSQQ